MKTLLALICIVTLVSFRPATEDPPAPALKTERIQVPGTHVKLVRPPGFEPTRGLNGFILIESTVSIFVNELPGAPFAETIKGFDDEKKLRRQGMKLVSRLETKVCGRTGVLLHLTQRQEGIDYSKWIAVCGDENATIQILAVFPTSLADEWSEPLKKIVLDAEWDPTLFVDPFGDLEWTVECPDGMSFAGRVGQMLAFNTEGKVPMKDLEAPNWMVGPSHGPGPDVDDLRKFSEKHLRQIQTLRKFDIQKSQAITIADLPGWELYGRAEHIKSETPRFFHHVLLLDDEGYVIMLGMASPKHESDYLPRFEKAARSWKPKPIETELEPASPTPPPKRAE